MEKQDNVDARLRLDQKGKGLMEWVQVPRWSQFGWLRHGFTTRQGGESRCYGSEGELNLGLTADDERETVLRNREQMTTEVGGPEFQLANVRQVHGTEIFRANTAGLAGEGDGLVTEVPGLLLGVLAADCVPVLLVDLRRRKVGAFHAGWRGTAAGMTRVGVARLVEEGADPADVLAAIGPSIGPCCYQVGPEVREAFAGAGGVFSGDRLNLWETNRRQLVGAGLGPEQVTVVGECTVCSRLGDGRRKYFSHRADGGRTGRMMGVIGVAADL